MAAGGLDAASCAYGLQLLPEPRDVDGEGVVVHELDVVPDGLKETVAGHDLSGAASKEVEEAAFLRRQEHLGAVELGGALGAVDEEAVHFEYVRICFGLNWYSP